MRRLIVMLSSVVVLAALVWSLRSPEPPIAVPSGTADSLTPTESLKVFCAASNRAVLEAIRADYERAYGVRIEIQYGPSQTLLSSIELTKTGDLFLPADDSYLDTAVAKGLIAEVIPLATMQVGAAVPKGNPLRISTLADLTRKDVKLVQAGPEATAVGKLTRDLLSKKSDAWNRLHERTVGYRGTVTDVANDVKVGVADVGIVFDAVLSSYPELEFVLVPELEPARASIRVGVISSSRQPRQALHFARFLGARDQGLKRYAEHGFVAVEGDAWADVPELTLYAGSMLRPAIERTILEFEEREGVRVNRIYNGCGILVAQMQGGRTPDAYFACDKEFMEQVDELFLASDDVSRNELVILVQKGNPHQLASLRDLTRPGLRVGIGHEKQCAMGWLTQRTLQEGGVQTEVMKNVTMQSPTGDMLVNQLKAGALDAAVAYLSNAAGSADVLDAVRIQGIPCSQAVQPYAVAVGSAHKHLADRLYRRVVAAESRDRFLQEGFGWIDDVDAVGGSSDKKAPQDEATPRGVAP